MPSPPRAGRSVPPTRQSRLPSPHGKSYQADIRDPASVARVFDQAEADFGGAPQAVIANAGINVPERHSRPSSPTTFAC